MKRIPPRSWQWLRWLGTAALAAACLLLYGQVRSQTPSKWFPLTSLSSTGHIESGMTGALLVGKPSGRATFTVTFPEPFRVAPRVVLTVMGDSEVITVARLTALPTTTGFQGIVSTPYFTPRQASSTVSVQWIAVSE